MSTSSSLARNISLLAYFTDTTLSELNDGLLREEEGLVANRGLVSTYVGGGLLGGAAMLNDNQTFLAYLTPELRRQYDSMVISNVEQVRGQERMQECRMALRLHLLYNAGTRSFACAYVQADCLDVVRGHCKIL
jgi:hypothetical protein